MITSFSVENFRGFKKFGIEQCKRINLISGRNGVGKTSLLEAIWLYHGRRNPTLFWNGNVLRSQIGAKQFNPLYLLSRESFGTIKFVAEDSEGHTSQMMFTSKEPDMVSVSLGGERESIKDNGSEIEESPLQGMDEGLQRTLNETIPEFLVEYHDSDAPYLKIKGGVSINDQGIVNVRFDGHMRRPKDYGNSILLTVQNRRINRVVVDRYSETVREGRGEELIEALRIIEPRLKSIELLTDGGIPSLWANLGNNIRIPAEQMGDGLSKVLSVYVALQAARNGVLLLDEIESGIHYSALEEFWSNVGKFAETFNVQVFATTHSRECIEAAYSAFPETSSIEFMLHRLYRKGDSVYSEPYEGEKLFAAIDAGFEVR